MGERDLRRWTMQAEEAAGMADDDAACRLRDMLGLLPGTPLGVIAYHVACLCIDHYTAHDAAMGQSFGARPYSPTDLSTWNRAQLVAELEARMGLRAPDTDWGWSAKDLCWHLVDRGTWRIIEVYPDGSWLVEGVDSAVEPTLTGPEGTFARAKRAAGLAQE